MKKNTVAFDFDNVIHKYREGWKDGSIYDDFNWTIIRLIKELLDEGHNVFIMTTRNRAQVRSYFDMINDAPAPPLIPFKYETFGILKKFWNKPGVCGICNHKAVFDVLVDDRAINFNPLSPTTKEQIISFKPTVYEKDN